MLGYRTHWGCLSSISRASHFQNFNLHQLIETSTDYRQENPISVINRKRHRVGIVSNIKFNTDKTEMSIEVDEDTSHFRRRLPLDVEGLPDNRLYLQPESEHMVVSANWAKRLGLPVQMTKRGVKQLLHSVIDEDRNRISRVLLNEHLPDSSRLWFRFVTPNGQVIPVQLNIEVDSVYGKYKTLYCEIEERDFSDLRQVSLHSLSIELGFPYIGNDVVRLVSRLSLENLLIVLEDCMAEEFIDSEITLSARADIWCCSFCEQAPGEQMALVLNLPGYTPTYNELAALPQRDYDQFKAGDGSSWKRLFKSAHEAGYHLTAALDDSRSLQLALTLNEQHD